MIIKKFSSFNESESNYAFEKLTGKLTLYRLTSHPVINLSEPGEYYVCNKESITPVLLDKKGGEIFLITVTCDANNIDPIKSKEECDTKSNLNIVAVKDDSKCDVVSATPYQS